MLAAAPLEEDPGNGGAAVEGEGMRNEELLLSCRISWFDVASFPATGGCQLRPIVSICFTRSGEAFPGANPSVRTTALSVATAVVTMTSFSFSPAPASPSCGL